jgi:DNA-binding CsgD family transcriptional regulator
MLVGRERELEAALAVPRAAAAGRGSTLVVVGEPGIGKTALLAATATAEPTWQTLRAIGVEAERAVAFATLQALLRPLQSALDELEAGQATLLRGVLDLGPQRGTSTFAVGAATLALLSVSSGEAPLVAVADDVHWADASSQEVLCFVGRRLEHERIALLAGVRNGEPTLLAEERSFARLELGPLEGPAARALLEQSASSDLDAAVADRLLETCAGNPLGLVELPQLLTDVQRAGREPLPTALTAGPLVQRAFAARVEALDEAAREALLVLAAAGEPGSAVRAMSPAARAALEQSEAAALVVSRGRLDFRHPLMRTAVYGAASPEARGAVHRRLADVVTGARRAWHLAEAAAGPDEAVAEALEQTSAEARAAGGVAAEAQALERAAELGVDPDRRARRMLGAARAWRLAGRLEHANRLLAEALPLAETAQTRAEIQLERGYNLLRDGATKEAHELVRSEAERVEEIDRKAAARLYAAVALAALNDPETGSALPPAERALELAGRSSDRVELEALFAAVSARMTRPLPPDETDERLVTRTEKLLADPELREGEQPHWTAYALAELEHDDDARRLSDVALGDARATGDVWSLSYGCLTRAAVELVVGRVDVARSWVAEALPLAEQIGEPWRLDQAHVVRIEIEAALGNLDECAAAFTAGEPTARLQLQLGKALLAVGRPVEAVPHLESARVVFAEGRPRSWYRHVPLELAEAYLGAGRRRDAERVLGEAAPAIERCRLVRPGVRLRRIQALLVSEAAVDAAFTQVLALLEDLPHQLERARTELSWGERLRESGRPEDAVPHLEHARARFEALGATGWAHRTRAQLEAASGTERPARAQRTEVLTAQELRIARHAAAGLRDREIAALLYLSPRTVESYLQSAYRKLGLSNRTQLAGVLAADGIRPIEPAAKVP